MMQSLINLFCTQDDDESNLAILLYESQGLLKVQKEMCLCTLEYCLNIV